MISTVVLLLLVSVKLIQYWLEDMSVEFYPNTSYIPVTMSVDYSVFAINPPMSGEP